MKNQKEKLLDYLVSESASWLSSQRLADYLAVSTRQMRKYVAQINAQWDSPIILSGSKGYKIDPEEYNKYIQTYKNETPFMRINYILQKLIISKNGYDVFDLSDELFVSVPTIENDLKSVRKIIRDYQLTLKREKNILLLEGREKKKRDLMSWIISSDSGENFVLQDELRLLIFHYELWGFRTTLKNIFTSNGIFVNDYTFNNITLHLIIMVDRIRNQWELEDEVSLEKIKKSSQYKVVLEIRKYIESTFQINISNAELYSMALTIYNNTSMIDHSSINGANIDQFVERKYIDITCKVIHDVETSYCLEPFDEDFIIKFTLHIKNLFERIKNNYSTANPLTHKIKNSYPLIYDIAVFIAQEFNKDYGISLTEDEITFLAFHIGAYFENNVQNRSKVICAFVYADYYSYYKNIIETLTRRFNDKIIIKYVISINNYKEPRDVDFIISTVEMVFSKNHVIISLFLNDQDVKNIGMQIEAIIKKKKTKALKAYLTNFFEEKIFYKNPEFADKHEALRHLCDDLLELDYTEPIFYRDVLLREELSNTVFHNVAVPHVLTKSAKTSFVSIVISERPIEWAGHFVYIIAMIGVHEDSRKVFSEVFESLIDILSDPSNVKRLVKAENFPDFINLLREFIDGDLP